jgi:hypothetical protein
LIASANEEILALLHELLKYLVRFHNSNTQPLYRDSARALSRSSSATDLAETKNLHRASMPVPVLKSRECISRLTESPESPVSLESAASLESPVSLESAASLESPMSLESAASLESPMSLESAASLESPVNPESHKSLESPESPESPLSLESPVNLSPASPTSLESPEEGIVLLSEVKTQLEASEVQVLEMRAAIDRQNGLIYFFNIDLENIKNLKEELGTKAIAHHDGSEAKEVEERDGEDSFLADPATNDKLKLLNESKRDWMAREEKCFRILHPYGLLLPDEQTQIRTQQLEFQIGEHESAMNNLKSEHEFERLDLEGRLAGLEQQLVIESLMDLEPVRRELGIALNRLEVCFKRVLTI